MNETEIAQLQDLAHRLVEKASRYHGEHGRALDQDRCAGCYMHCAAQELLRAIEADERFRMEVTE